MGKSTATQMLREMGVPVHDADAAVHALMEPGGAGFQLISKYFPDVIKDGAIDRQALGAIVFADPEKKKKLEGILHPLVRADGDAFKKQQEERGHNIVVFDIPLLFETEQEGRFDHIICISAPAAVQKERVLNRPHMSEEKLQAVLATQMPDAQKRKKSDFVVMSDKGMEQMRRDLFTIMQDLGFKKKPRKKCQKRCKGPTCSP